MTDNFYNLPLWIQIYVQQDGDVIIRSQLRQTSKSLNSNNLLSNLDYISARDYQKLGWWRTNKDFILIADDSDEGIEIYNYYDNMFKSASLFLKKYNQD